MATGPYAAAVAGSAPVQPEIETQDRVDPENQEVKS